MKITLNVGNPAGLAEYDAPPHIDGDAITIRGIKFDFSPLPDGAQIEIGDPFFGPVKRIHGQIELTVNYMYNPDISEPNQSTDWADYTFEVESGQCPCPIKRKPLTQEL